MVARGYEGDGMAVAAALESMGLTAMSARHLESRYHPGPSRGAWLRLPLQPAAAPAAAAVAGAHPAAGPVAGTARDDPEFGVRFRDARQDGVAEVVQGRLDVARGGRDGGQGRLHAANRLQLLADAGERDTDGLRIHLDGPVAQRGERQQASQPEGRLQRGAVRRLGIEDAVDVAGADIERRDPGRRMGRREHDQGDGRIAVGARLAQLVAHGPAGDGPVLGLDDHADVGAAGDLRVERQHEVALLGGDRGAGLQAGPVEEVAAPASDVAQEVGHQRLEVGALGGRSGPFGAARRGGRLDGREAVVQLREAVADLLAELVQRRVEARRVEQQREARRVAIEVGAQQLAHAADGTVAALLVEQVVDERAERAAIAQELLQGARQAPVAVGEVEAQRLFQRAAGLLVGDLGARQQGVELVAYDVHVDRHAGVLERHQADAHGALDDRRAAPRRDARPGTRPPRRPPAGGPGCAPGRRRSRPRQSRSSGAGRRPGRTVTGGRSSRRRRLPWDRPRLGTVQVRRPASEPATAAASATTRGQHQEAQVERDREEEVAGDDGADGDVLGGVHGRSQAPRCHLGWHDPGPLTPIGMSAGRMAACSGSRAGCGAGPRAWPWCSASSAPVAGGRRARADPPRRPRRSDRRRQRPARAGLRVANGIRHSDLDAWPDPHAVPCAAARPRFLGILQRRRHPGALHLQRRGRLAAPGLEPCAPGHRRLRPGGRGHGRERVRALGRRRHPGRPVTSLAAGQRAGVAGRNSFGGVGLRRAVSAGRARARTTTSSRCTPCRIAWAWAACRPRPRSVRPRPGSPWRRPTSRGRSAARAPCPG